MFSQTNKNEPTLCLSDFQIGSTLGSGAYAKVLYATHKTTKEQFAIKMMSKALILRERKTELIQFEKNILFELSHPLIVRLHCTFQDEDNLYLVFELCKEGDLASLIRKFRKSNAGHASFELTQFFIAEIVLALEYIHNKNIIHRDIKPENILISHNGHIKLCDFGSAKSSSISSCKSSELFCGTPEYLSPEVLRDNMAYKASDLWALGCITFALLNGYPPFRGSTDYETFQLTLKHKRLVYPTKMPEQAKLFCQELLQEMEYRLGVDMIKNDEGVLDCQVEFNSIKNHSFFMGIDWDTITTINSPYQTIRFRLESLPNPNILNRRKSKTNNQNEMIRNILNKNDEAILLESSVSYGKGIFARKRKLLLTSKHRLLITDRNMSSLKLEITKTNGLHVLRTGDHTFEIITPKKTFQFIDHYTDSLTWKRLVEKSLG